LRPYPTAHGAKCLLSRTGDLAANKNVIKEESITLVNCWEGLILGMMPSIEVLAPLDAANLTILLVSLLREA